MLGVLLSRVVGVGHGTLTVIWRNGRQTSYGAGLPHATMRLHGRGTAWRLASHPDLKLGECYMDGSLTVEHGDIADVLDILMAGVAAMKPPLILRLWRQIRRWFRPISQYNPTSRARRNVAHHYDLSGELYDLFLDSDRQYSCAYFATGRESLEEAQVAKKRHIAAKLALTRPGLKVLDIGSGWGGLALDLARDTQAEVLGVTLSQEQLALATKRAVQAGLDEHCRFELRDYRTAKGPFDRIVSVGMFEHVGVGYYDVFFGKVRELLADDGVMLLHTIGRTDGAGATNPWTAKYIFPGGYVPALSEVMPAVERNGLILTDVEVLRLHYAQTLKAWRARFRKNWSKAAALYDERFCRMWDFYLAGSEMAFRREGLVVFQLQVTKKIDTLPLSRDYMLEAERAMRFAGPERVLRPVEAAE